MGGESDWTAFAFFQLPRSTRLAAILRPAGKRQRRVSGLARCRLYQWEDRGGHCGGRGMLLRRAAISALGNAESIGNVQHVSLQRGVWFLREHHDRLRTFERE